MPSVREVLETYLVLAQGFERDRILGVQLCGGVEPVEKK